MLFSEDTRSPWIIYGHFSVLGHRHCLHHRRPRWMANTLLHHRIVAHRLGLSHGEPLHKNQMSLSCRAVLETADRSLCQWTVNDLLLVFLLRRCLCQKHPLGSSPTTKKKRPGSLFSSSVESKSSSFYSFLAVDCVGGLVDLIKAIICFNLDAATVLSLIFSWRLTVRHYVSWPIYY